jgi:putative DNA-invertase from lambdoid prophage Rac
MREVARAYDCTVVLIGHVSKTLNRDNPAMWESLDRLRRNAIDVATTVDRLASMGVRVHCPALGGVDLTSRAGRMTMGVINAVAQFERDLLIERTQAGLQRAKAEGATFGRPTILDASQRDAGGIGGGRQRVGNGQAL